VREEGAVFSPLYEAVQEGRRWWERGQGGKRAGKEEGGDLRKRTSLVQIDSHNVVSWGERGRGRGGGGGCSGVMH
jgi:hypothetical protein